MKRKKLLRHLKQHGCREVREGRKHTIVVNPANGAESQVPRHVEIKAGTVRGICNDLGIPVPTEK